MAWNLFYTEEELRKAREKADEFAGIKYEQPTAGAMETLFPSNATYSYQDGTRVENIIPIADKQVVSKPQPRTYVQIPQVTNDNLLRTRTGNVDSNTGMVRQGPLTQQGLFDAGGTVGTGTSDRFKMNFSALGPLAAELQRAGTPLRYRKDMPTGQDIRLKNLKSQTDAMTAQAALGKSGMTNFYKNVNASEIPSSVLTKMFMPEFGGLFGSSKEEAEALANQRAAAFISKRGEMVSAGKNPTMKEVLDALKEELNK